MKLLTLCFSSIIVLAGCFTAPSIDSIDTKGKNQVCVRQCTETYSRCIGSSFGWSAQSACGSGYKACANTCPDK